MTITLNRPAPALLHSSSTGSAARAYAQPVTTLSAERASAAPSQRVTITLTVDLPREASAADATLLADQLRSHAHGVAAARGGVARVSISTSDAPVFTQVQPAQPAQPQQRPQQAPARRGGLQSVELRPRKVGAVSPTAPARRDAEAARLRLLHATAVSPVSPASPAEAARTGALPVVGTGLVIDLYGRRARIDGADVSLTHREFELLAFLARHARAIISREDLMEFVWKDPSVGERTVDVHIRRVRNKLGRYRSLISTVRGAGYRLDLGSDVAIIGKCTRLGAGAGAFKRAPHALT